MQKGKRKEKKMKKKHKRKESLLFISILWISSILCGCSAAKINLPIETSVSERSIFAMDTYMNLKIYGKQAEEALDQACDKIEELENLLSVTIENSDIWKINQANGNTITVKEDTASILQTALEIGNETQGALDITLYPIVKEWGFTTGEYKIPKEETLKSLLEYVDYQQIELNGNQVHLPKGTQIDCGALAKGYTGDRIIELLKENQIKSALINLGGNVQLLGSKPDGTLWKIGIRNPFELDKELCILSLSDKAVITSGNYERYFIGEDGKSYCHIMDAENGYPAENGLVSVTVIGKEGVRCDALSTALFVKGLKKATEFWQEKKDFDMILVTEEKTIYLTEGIAADFQNMSNMEVKVLQ